MEQMIALWSMVMVHGLMVAGPGVLLILSEIVGLETDDPRRASWGRKSNVVHAQAAYLARPTTKAPETQIYFINHRSGALSGALSAPSSAENGQVGRL